MASSSYCLGVFSLAVLLPFLFVSPAGSTKFIDVICKHVHDKAFCTKTLKAYPPVASATSELQAANATISLVRSYALKSADFAGKAAKVNPKLKASQDSFVSIGLSLRSAAGELIESPGTANYDVSICIDQIMMIQKLVEKNKDSASKTIITKSLMLEKLLDVGVGATIAVGGYGNFML